MLKLKKCGLVTPSQGTVKILILMEKSPRQTMNVVSIKNICPQETVQYIVKREIDSQDPLLLGNHILDT